ncbi:MAG: glycosyltransferase [Nitrospirota bacterium]
MQALSTSTLLFKTLFVFPVISFLLSGWLTILQASADPGKLNAAFSPPAYAETRSPSPTPSDELADSIAPLQQARQLINEDQLEEASQILKTLLAHDPNAFEVRQEWARLLTKMGRPKEAVPEYERLYVLDPHNQDLLTEFAWTLMQASYFSQAASIYNQLLQENPTAVDLHLLKAMALHGMGDDKEAIKEYETVLKLAPSNIEARVGLQELQELRPGRLHLKVGGLLSVIAFVILVSLVVLTFRSSRSQFSKTVAARLKEIYIHSVALVSLVVATYYVTWRLTYTMNWEAWWFSIPVFMAELYGVLTAYAFFFVVWSPTHRTPPPAPPGRTVDVFVTTYDEDPSILRRTLLGCLAITYPHETYVLDDGHRPEVARLARELGCRYISREKNIHAKAGNLNNALRRTSGEFIVTLDADHVPLPQFIDRLLGYFSDDQVAFVQTPQDFYNVDSFQHRLDAKHRRMWTEQSLFFSVIQPGKDRWNSAFFCGSCAIIRRSALKDVGGFAEATVTEDLHTSILLHAKGHRSVYHNESLAYGLAAASALPFHVQRLRWGQGAMQVLVRDNPLWVKGLTVPQRISYLSSTTTYFDGFQKLIYYLSPVVYFLTGVLPIKSFGVVFLLHFIPYFILLLLSFELMSRGHGSTWMTEQYNMAKFATFMKTSLGLFSKKRLQFQVTPKSRDRETDDRLVYPQRLIFLLNVTGVGVGTLRYFWKGDLETLAFFGNLLWAFLILGLASVMIRFSRSKIQFRTDYRFLYLIPCTFFPLEGDPHSTQIGLIRDCHETGASLITAQPIPDATNIHLSMTVGERPLSIEGVAVHSDRERTGRRTFFQHGVRFTKIRREDQDHLIRYNFEYSVPQFMQTFNKPRTVFEQLERYLKQEQRKQKRWALSLPTTLRYRLQDAAHEILAATDDISEGGLSVITTETLPMPGSVDFTITLADQQIQGSGTILHKQNLSFENFPMSRYVLQFQTSASGQMDWLKQLSALFGLTHLR